jgi:hypothetical protein
MIGFKQIEFFDHTGIVEGSIDGVILQARLIE